MPDSFIGCDWGTTGFRLALVTGHGRGEEGTDVILLTEREPGKWPRGIAETFSQWQASGESDRQRWYRGKLIAAVRDAIAPFGDDVSDLPVVVSGMASSSLGILEIPYSRAPFPLHGASVRWSELSSADSCKVHVLSGVCATEDIIRGEETQVMGLAHAWGVDALNGRTLVMPGTHSKHVVVEDGSLVSVKTFMTGELFALFSTHSVLRHSVRTEIPAPESVGDALRRGLDAGVDGEMPSRLFSIRAGHVLGSGQEADRTGFLLGLLIGAELGTLLNFPGELLLCSGSRQAAYYRFAMAHLFPKNHQVMDDGLVERSAFLGQAVWWFNSENRQP